MLPGADGTYVALLAARQARLFVAAILGSATTKPPAAGTVKVISAQTRLVAVYVGYWDGTQAKGAEPGLNRAPAYSRPQPCKAARGVRFRCRTRALVVDAGAELLAGLPACGAFRLERRLRLFGFRVAFGILIEVLGFGFRKSLLGVICKSCCSNVRP